MPPLFSDHRKLLEKTVIAARVAAVKGAEESLRSLAIGEAKPFDSMTEAQKDLRRRLRARGRQLGDSRSPNGTQTIRRLTQEIAYEHWHRMLFARFLAENHLLIEPDSKVAVSMDEVEEIAREEGIDPRELAASYAQRSLPQIFRTDDPVFEVAFAPETRVKLDRLLDALLAEVFTGDDALGWVYQFWQSAEKDEVNARVKSGEKITGETLPAVTQLFTEHYMVQFLLHNTIGAWHAGKALTSRDREGADSEQALRDAVKLAPLSGYDFEYLRFVREANEGEDLNAGTGPWRPAAGTYDGWPLAAAELRVLDPCCGSGHFLVAAFELLVRLRIAEEGLSAEAAIRAVLAGNLFGLELDPRCTQIAAFNLAFAAWKLAGKPIDLPALNIACSGIGPQSTKDEWLKMADDANAWEGISPGNREFVRNGLIDLHETFSKAPELGSLIDPGDRSTDLITADFETLKPFLDRILAAESADDEAHERAVAAHGMAAAAEILSGRGFQPLGIQDQRQDAAATPAASTDYTLVITNVPYLGRGSQSDGLKAFAETNYKEAKADLATVFVARMLRWVGDGRNETLAGTVAAVTPQNWLFLTSYKKLRERLLKERSFDIIGRLGPKGFQTPMWDFNVMLIGMSGGKAGKAHIIAGVDVMQAKTAAAKAALLCGEAAADAPPDHAAAPSSVAPDPAADSDTPPDDAGPADGSVRLVPQREQVRNPDARLSFEQRSIETLTGEIARAFQGLKTGDDDRFRRYWWELSESSERWPYYQTTVDATCPWAGLIYRVDAADGDAQWARPQGKGAWGRPGVAISQMSNLPVALYSGAIFDSNMSAFVPKKIEHAAALWSLCEDSNFCESVRAFDQSLKVPNGSFEKIPFDLDHWQQVAAEKYPNGLPEPQSDDPTQWLFHGRPERADLHTALQVGVARLVGYRWPAELDEDIRLAPEARELVNRCAELADHADDDGIVCLTPLRGEASAADRLRALLRDAFAGNWTSTTETRLLKAAGDEHDKGKVCKGLEEWLRDSFFEHHCKLFHHRPFVWHIWDGRKDGFSALVNSHKLAGPDGHGNQTLRTLTYAYLRDWITRQEQGVANGDEGADARLAAAQKLKDELEKILKGEPPYDLFVRWKALHEQPIGWEPDINDGVRLNIRPLLQAEDVGKKRAGVLRWKPNIKWTKDRGKEPQSLRPSEQFPWFWTWDERTEDFEGTPDFDGARWNDLHYTITAKQAARAEAEQTEGSAT